MAKPKTITFNSAFSKNKLRKTRGRILREMEDAKNNRIILTPPDGIPTAKDINKAIKRVLDRFAEYHAQKGKKKVSVDYTTRLQLLTNSLRILGNNLNLQHTLSIYEQVVSVDWLAHMALDKDKRYRDHITHPAHVTALGCWMLNNVNYGKLLDSMAAYYEKSFKKFYGGKLGEPEGHEWKWLVEYAWLACGLLHDSAYPLEYTLRLSEDVFGSYDDVLRLGNTMNSRFTRGDRRKTLIKPLEESWFLEQNKDFEDRLEALPKEEGPFKHAHTVLGALSLLSGFKNDLGCAQGFVLQMAANAIVHHHDDDSAKKINKSWDPLSRLLFVADGLHAWERQFLHREPMSGSDNQRLQTIVECDYIKLKPRKTEYFAKFHMNESVKGIVRGEPYDWNFDDFKKPNVRLEEVLKNDPLLPTIKLTDESCIVPKDFPK